MNATSNPPPTQAPKQEEPSSPQTQAPAPSETKTPAVSPPPKPQNLSLLISIMLVLLFIGMILGFYQLTSEVIKRHAAGENLRKQQASAAQIQQLQTQYQDELDTINQVFPSEQQLIGVIERINHRLSAFPDPQLRFDTNAPVLGQGEQFPFLPVTITFTAASITEVEKLLDDLTAGGLVYTPQDVDLAIRPEPENSVKATLKGKLYVQTN